MRLELCACAHNHSDRFIWTPKCPACNPPWPEMDAWEKETFGDK